MQFAIDRSDLLAAIEKCILAVPDSRHPTEAFRMMLVEGRKKHEKSSVRFAAVGEQLSVDTVAPADVTTGGSFKVLPHYLRDVAQSMPAGRMQFTMKGTRITVKSLVSSRKATFESHSVEVRPIDEPGSEAQWITVDSQELVKALQAVKLASAWYERTDPVASLLIPTARGLEVFGCNMYVVAVVQTSIRLDGEPIVMPATAAAVLALMAPDDANVRIVKGEGDRRIYLETADTLVGANLFQYNFLSTHKNILSLFEDNLTVGPTFKLKQLEEAVKAQLKLTGFAGAQERNSFGISMWLSFKKQSVVIEFEVTAASGHDELDVLKEGAEFKVKLSSRPLEHLLACLSAGGAEDVQAALAVNEPTKMLVLRSQGVRAAVLTAKE